MAAVKPFLNLVVALCMLAAWTTPAHADDYEGGNPDAVGHSADGYYLDFSPFGKVELPRLILRRTADGTLGFDVFGSTEAALHAGTYQLLSAQGTPLTEAETQEVIAAHTHFKFPLVPKQGAVLVDFSISRQLVFVFISAFLVLILGLRLAGMYRRGIGRDTAPRGTFQNVMEATYLFVRDEIGKPTLGPKTEKYMPYLITVFLFILFGNIIGLIPLGVTATANIMVTAALATITFVITQFAGTKDYWKHIFNPPGMPLAVKIILVPIEILGMFTKPLALAFRLFGNMVSGHLVILSILGLVFIFTAQYGSAAGVGIGALVSVPLTIFIYLLKLAVSLIQAYVFTILSALFIGLAAEEHAHHEDHAPGVPHAERTLDSKGAIAGNGFARTAAGSSDVVVQPSMAS